MANITFLSPGLNKNRGGERVIFKYALALTKFGHNVTIVVPKNTVFLNSNAINILEYSSILPPFYSRQLGYIDAIWPAISKIPKNTEILIGTYIPQLIISNIYKILTKNIKYIVFNQDFTDMFTNRPERKLMFKYYPKLADKIISISHFCAKEIKDLSGRDSVIIPNGIEEDFIVNNIVLEKENYIFWLGSKNKHKGFQDFWNAMNIVWEKFPNIKLITTEGAFATNNNTQIITINGNIELLKSIYQKATLFVCSSHSEGFGLPALEAMASGCPVVTTDTGGSREYSKHNYNCVVVEKKKPQKLAEGILNMLNNPQKREFFAQNGVTTAKKYKWQNAFTAFNNAIIEE